MADTKTPPLSNSNILFPEMQPFWDALEEGKLLLKRCDDCSKNHFYPRTRCPFCGSDQTRWLPSTGKGTIYSFSVERRSSPLVASAVIELEEDVQLVSLVVEADTLKLEIGQEVTLYPVVKNGRTEIAFTTPQAQRARTYALQATQQAAQPTGLNTTAQRAFSSAAVIGGGTMGIGIAMAFANAEIPVLLIDRDDAALQVALGRVRSQYEASVQRSRLTPAQAQERIARISCSTDMAALGSADVIVEAVWEQMALKRSVFEQIDRHAKLGALLGTNTSGLDINELARATKRPADVIGLHFFSPANVMKLLEVVRGSVTSDASIARAFAVARVLAKVPVLVENCPGFAGNRILRKREHETRLMLVEGATPEQVDRVQREFGLPMGSFELSDMSGGVELQYRKSQDGVEIDWLTREMYRLGRLGQKVGKGYYRYEPGSRVPRPDPEMNALLEQASREAGLVRRQLSDQEVSDRMIMSMINEAAQALDEGVVQRPSDIDAVWLNGYGWPKWRGGVLYHADELGVATVRDRLIALQKTHGERFKPAPLLVRLADSGARFLDLPARPERSPAFLG